MIVHDALGTVEEVCQRHGISALAGFLETCRAVARDETLNIAVLGRFKAGKSSFLNHLLGRPLLPIGVIPVTSAVTGMQWGPAERAAILFADGRSEPVPVARIGEFRACVELPAMAPYRGIRFVDTPGLALVAVGVDPPLAQHDLELIRQLRRYTPAF